MPPPRATWGNQCRLRLFRHDQRRGHDEVHAGAILNPARLRTYPSSGPGSIRRGAGRQPGFAYNSPGRCTDSNARCRPPSAQQWRIRRAQQQPRATLAALQPDDRQPDLPVGGRFIWLLMLPLEARVAASSVRWPPLRCGRRSGQLEPGRTLTVMLRPVFAARPHPTGSMRCRHLRCMCARP